MTFSLKRSIQFNALLKWIVVYSVISAPSASCANYTVYGYGVGEERKAFTLNQSDWIRSIIEQNHAVFSSPNAKQSNYRPYFGLQKQLFGGFGFQESESYIKPHSVLNYRVESIHFLNSWVNYYYSLKVGALYHWNKYGFSWHGANIAWHDRLFDLKLLFILGNASVMPIYSAAGIMKLPVEFDSFAGLSISQELELPFLNKRYGVLNLWSIQPGFDGHYMDFSFFVAKALHWDWNFQMPAVYLSERILMKANNVLQSTLTKGLDNCYGVKGQLHIEQKTLQWKVGVSYESPTQFFFGSRKIAVLDWYTAYCSVTQGDFGLKIQNKLSGADRANILSQVVNVLNTEFTYDAVVAQQPLSIIIDYHRIWNAQTISNRYGNVSLSIQTLLSANIKASVGFAHTFAYKKESTEDVYNRAIFQINWRSQ